MHAPLLRQLETIRSNEKDAAGLARDELIQDLQGHKSDLETGVYGCRCVTYLAMCVCVCVCVCTYMYMCVCVCVCVCVYCIYVYIYIYIHVQGHESDLETGIWV